MLLGCYLKCQNHGNVLGCIGLHSATLSMYKRCTICGTFLAWYRHGNKICSTHSFTHTHKLASKRNMVTTWAHLDFAVVQTS